MKADFLDEFMKTRGEETPGKARERILKGAKGLEAEFAQKRISKEDYERENAEMHRMLALLDLECAIRKITERTKSLVKEREQKKMGEKRRQELREIEAERKAIEKECKEAKRLFESGKISYADLKELLRAKHADALENEESTKELFRRELSERTEKEKIMLSTAKELERQKAEEIIADLGEQLNSRHREEIPFPAREKIEVEEPRKRRRDRHLV